MNKRQQRAYLDAAEQLFNGADSGFVLIDSEMQVVITHGQITEWIEIDTLVGDAMPFLAGYEDVIAQLSGGALEGFSLPYIAYSRVSDEEPMVLSIRLFPSGDDGCVGALLRDDSAKYTLERDLLQNHNDLILAQREATRLNSIIQNYEEEVSRDRFEGFLGSSLNMQAVYHIIDSAAASDATVLITGESGTGKEICAEAIHGLSKRKDGPLITVNCAAIPHDLIESELFGHVKGAFTGATANRKGAAGLAHRGTLFLDEICEMDVSLQAKLLRFIQSRKLQMVGKSEVEDVDVRIICATNRVMLDEVEAERFREDLYYRLNVIPITLPPLRERGNDVIQLAEAFLKDFAKTEGKQFTGFDDQAGDLLARHSWPGNVRELQNIIQRVVVLNDAENVGADMLAGLDDTRAQPGPGLPPGAVAGSGAAAVGAEGAEPVATGAPEILPLSEVERRAIEGAIALSDGNVRLAASQLGIAPATIYRKISGWKKDDPAGD
jgi:transcriptional regulator with PAS, ATPase and Fis domain